MSDTAAITDISDTTIVGELIVDTTTVSKMLGIQESTIRKYCTLMQKHQYQFNKNSVGHRIFYPEDVEILKEIINLKNSSSLTLNEAVQAIVESATSDITDIAPITSPDHRKLQDQFEAFKDEQIQFNRKLLEQLEKQQKENSQLLEQLVSQQDYIKHSIEERDKKLMHSIKESMEARRQQAAAEAEKESVRKKATWWKFWRGAL